MTTVSIPASLRDATERLSSLDKLIKAREWEKAAVVAAFVRLDPGGGGRNARKPAGSGGFVSATEFSELGINGLRSKGTVTLYVQHWLDAHEGVYPEPGAKVKLPDLDWPPTSLEDDRYQISDAEAIAAQAAEDGTGASKAIDIAKNTKAMAAAIKASPAVAAAALAALPPQVIAQAVRQPEVAEAIAADPEASVAVNDAELDKVRPTAHRGGTETFNPVVTAIDKLIVDIGARMFGEGGKRMYEALLARQEAMPLRPNEIKAVVAAIDQGIRYGADAKALLTPVSDEALAELLGGQEGR